MHPDIVRKSSELRGPVLITGGAGFVGSHIARRLREFVPVHVFDDLSTGSMDHLPAGVTFHLGDVRRRTDVQRVLAAAPFQAVIHCAAQTSVARSMEDPNLDWEVNVLGTHCLVREARKAGVRRFVYFSSGGAVYGNTERPALESDMPTPMSHYGLNKLAAEQVVRLEAPSYAILRPSNIYGPGQRSDLEGGVIAIFLERLLNGESIELHGDGSQQRDFVFVDDVVAAVEVALATHENAIWNVASGETTSVASLLEHMQAIVGSDESPRYAPRRAGDVDISTLSPDALTAAGWGRPVRLAEGLRKLVEATRGETLDYRMAPKHRAESAASR